MIPKRILMCWICLITAISGGFTRLDYPEKLSEWGLFEGPMSDLKAAKNTLPYGLNSPLFSDYAHKLRLIRLPQGSQVNYQAQGVLEFPEGTVVAKTFYYPQDEKQAQGPKTIMETRILWKKDGEWKALPYVWNEAQTEAYLEVAGANRAVAWKNIKGQSLKLNYEIPNQNQCKGCHDVDGKMQLIGPSARQLNGDFPYEDGPKNQLQHWKSTGILSGASDPAQWPKMSDYRDESQALEGRVRAYLDVNCAHCHSPKGPAKNAGLNLSWDQDPHSVAYGRLKSPVAAGRGSGNLSYDIQPGKAKESIVYHRMASTDPGVRMPELGRQMIHKEGLVLVKQWIDGLKP